MVVVPDLRAAHPAEKFLSPIRASAVLRMGFLVIDPLDLETLMCASHSNSKVLMPTALTSNSTTKGD
jgi:hypothetical protein